MQVVSGITRVLSVILMEDILLHPAGIIDHMASGEARTKGCQGRRNRSWDRVKGSGRDRSRG